MIVEADFTMDDSLAEGERVITRVKKPEVHFNGDVIQVGKSQCRKANRRQNIEHEKQNRLRH